MYFIRLQQVAVPPHTDIFNVYRLQIWTKNGSYKLKHYEFREGKKMGRKNVAVKYKFTL